MKRKSNKKKIAATRFQKSVHLPESDLLPVSKYCPFCRNTDRVKIGVIQDNPEVAILTCANCRGSSVDRMPTSDSLEKYYRNYYVKGKDTNVTIDLPQKLAIHILRQFRFTPGRHKDKVSILDFGGGDGTVALELAKRLLLSANKTVDICVVDFNACKSNTGDKRIHMKCQTNLDDIDNDRYDIVIASAIIEHIPEPAPILTKLFGVMETGGIFYARTPYVLPLMKFLGCFGLKIDFTFPGHVHDLGRPFWEGILDWLPIEGEFQCIRSRPSIVETTVKEQFLRTVIAYILKSPSYIIRKWYGLVGGWEIFITRVA